MRIYNKYLSTNPMAFRIQGVEVFSDNGALTRESIESSRDGSSSDITGTDELLLLDGDGVGDVMRVTVDEFFDRNINMEGILPTAIDLRYSDFFSGSFLSTRVTNNVNSALTLTTDQFLRLTSINMAFVTAVEIQVKWSNSDNAYGFDRVEAAFDGSTVVVTDISRASVPLNSLRAERLFNSTGNTGVPYYEQEGSLLWVGFQNNGGPLINCNVNVTYVTDTYPSTPPAP